jgi:acetyl esterase/lipase
MSSILRWSGRLAWLGVILVTGWAWRTPAVAFVPDWQGLGLAHTAGRVFSSPGSVALTLDVYQPESAAKGPGTSRLRPAIVFVHGGSWMGGSMTAARLDPRLAQQGLVVFAIDYRLARPGAPSWPAAVGDIREAIRWVRRHSQEFGIDPARVGLVGQSSGGHLAAMVAALPESRGPDGVSSRVQAVVSFYGPTDLTRLMQSRRLTHEPACVLLGAEAGTAADIATAASPIEYVTADDPPTLLIHGSDDDWVPLDQSVKLTSALAMAGIPHRLIVVEGARHGFETLIESPGRRDLLPEILAFLQNAWNISSVAFGEKVGG